MSDKQREAFELWQAAMGNSVAVDSKGEYSDIFVSVAWKVWQAAQTAMLRELPVEALEIASTAMADQIEQFKREKEAGYSAEIELIGSRKARVMLESLIAEAKRAREGK